ncbi:MAG: hypothetical protein HC914_21335 [Chloroflexaceae bacterium]|nr:hypothetical protein [Chloroflexaceae bacterium]
MNHLPLPDPTGQHPTQVLWGALPALRLSARRVLELRFGFWNEGCHTRAEVGRRLGISPARVRQIEQHALVQLRTVLTAPPL